MLQGFGLGQFEKIFRDKQPVVDIGHGIFDESMVLAGAKKNADRRLISLGYFVDAIIADISIQLAEVFVSELIHLEFDQHMAFEHAMIKHEVDEEGLAADEQPFLRRFEAETVAKFKQESLQLLQ